jgi:xylan 1,4-beta-xylosidase
VLPGFHPDPSIVRVGDDYYVATSTFEWWPGVSVYHSRDLVNFRLLTHVLTRQSQLDLRGIKESAGIYAPQLSCANGRFYLAYTIVSGPNWPYMDVQNYLVESDRIDGDWSEPTYLHGLGFDPSLFHDGDGRSYLLANEIDFRGHRRRSVGIVLQEYDRQARRLIGESRVIYDGDAEGPHLYHIGPYYYLMTAEGGTGYKHRTVVLRAKNPFGPYEPDPQNPIITSEHDPDLVLQKAGHASLVQTQTGEYYLAHLTARPLTRRGKCPLGRETAIQRAELTSDGWIRLKEGGRTPCERVVAPDLPPCPFPKEPARDHFDQSILRPSYMTLREPADPSWLSLERRPGYLSLRGRASTFALFKQSMLARRIQSFCFRAETALEFAPKSYRQMAGLICYYDTRNHFYLRLSHDEEVGRSLNVVRVDGSAWHAREILERPVPVDSDRIILAVTMQREALDFSYSEDGVTFRSIGPTFDSGELSDEHENKSGFTGAFVGLCAQDLAQAELWADFDYFEYRETIP